MVLDPRVAAGQVTAADFQAIGEHAEELVRLALEQKLGAPDPKLQSARRRYSQRDVVAVTGASFANVSKWFGANKDKFDEGDKALAKGRQKRYSVDQYLLAVNSLSKAPSELPRARAATLTWANYKGGCAKSTSVATFAAGQALKAKRVLLVDMDPQGTLSALFGLQPSLDIGAEDTLLPYFEGDQPSAEYAVKPTRLPTLDIIPASSALSHADITIPMRSSRKELGGVLFFRLLDVALEPLRSQYDLILIDSPPSLSYLTTLACYAGDGLIIPLQPSMPDYASSATFFRQMGSFFGELDEASVAHDRRGPKAYRFARMVLTRHDGSRPNRDMEQDIRATYGGLVVGPVMIESNAVKEASNNHLTIYEIDPQFVHRDTLARALQSADDLGKVIEDLAASVPDAIAARPVAA